MTHEQILNEIKAAKQAGDEAKVAQLLAIQPTATPQPQPMPQQLGGYGGYPVQTPAPQQVSAQEFDALKKELDTVKGQQAQSAAESRFLNGLRSTLATLEDRDSKAVARLPEGLLALLASSVMGDHEKRHNSQITVVEAVEAVEEILQDCVTHAAKAKEGVDKSKEDKEADKKEGEKEPEKSEKEKESEPSKEDSESGEKDDESGNEKNKEEEKPKSDLEDEVELDTFSYDSGGEELSDDQKAAEESAKKDE